MSPRFTDEDLAYLRQNYLTLEDLCAGRPETPAQVRELIDAGLLPRPSYVLVDGTAMFPADYFRLYDEAGNVDRLSQVFRERYRQAAQPYPELATADAVENAWSAYLRGVWGQCLVEVTPEVVVRKRALVNSLCRLIALPRPRNSEWCAQLREEVSELDEIERDFAPDYDRAEEWNDRPPSRDLLINVARERFPDVFSEAERPVEVG